MGKVDLEISTIREAVDPNNHWLEMELTTLVALTREEERKLIQQGATVAYVRDRDGALMYLIRFDVLDPKETP